MDYPDVRRLTRICFLEQDPAFRCQPEHNLARGFSPVEKSLGEQDTDTGPDTTLPVNGEQLLDYMTDMAALLVGHCLENMDVYGIRYEHLRDFKGYCFHGFTSRICPVPEYHIWYPDRSSCTCKLYDMK